MLDPHSQMQATAAAVHLLEQQGIEAYYDEASGVIVLPRNDWPLPSQMAAIFEYLLNMMITQSDVLDTSPRVREDLILLFQSAFKMHNMEVDYDEGSGMFLVPPAYEQVGNNQLAAAMKKILYLAGHRLVESTEPGVVKFIDHLGANQIQIPRKD
jgi:hypothetical protein